MDEWCAVEANQCLRRAERIDIPHCTHKSSSERQRLPRPSLRTRWVFIWKLCDAEICSYEFHDSALATAF
jgi:hypothetical protein